MNENYNDCHQRKTTHTSKYIQKAKKRSKGLYKKPSTFQKVRQFPLRFYIQKAIDFT